MTTVEFQRWSRTLDTERRAKVRGAIARIVDGGPTLGRPHVDVIHGSRVRKLKEARVDRGMRLLFAFDSNQSAVMLVGGDKTGKWNRWYPRKIELAERLDAHTLYMRGVSHDDVLAALDVVDEEMSEAQRREDLYLSALEHYVEALGGRIEVRAVFDEDEVLVRGARDEDGS